MIRLDLRLQGQNKGYSHNKGIKDYLKSIVHSVYVWLFIITFILELENLNLGKQIRVSMNPTSNCYRMKMAWNILLWLIALYWVQEMGSRRALFFLPTVRRVNGAAVNSKHWTQIFSLANKIHQCLFIIFFSQNMNG